MGYRCSGVCGSCGLGFGEYPVVSQYGQYGALVPTSGVLAAGGDEVSAMVAALFSSHAQAYQALSAQAASFHAQFVQLMNTGASRYALTEAANASPLLETLDRTRRARSTPSRR